MRRRASRLLVAGAAALLGGLPLLASAPRSWSDRSREAFGRGELHGVSVGGIGEVRLAPELRQWGDGTDPRIWSVAVDGDGRVWGAAGGGGRLYRLDPGDGSLVPVLQAEEPEVLAVTAAGRTVYAATGPGGRVYRLQGDAEPEVFFDPPETYVWDLAVGPSGALFVATGDPGRIHRVTADGEASLLYASPEAHVRCLAVDAEGRLLAGTDGTGYVYRFDGAGRPTVLFVSPEGEITDLVAAPDGTVHVATVGAAAGSGARTPAAVAGGVAHVTVVASAEGPPPPASSPAPQPAAPPVPRPGRAGTGGRSAIYALDADGYARRLFRSDRHQILSLALRPAGALLAGTAEGGILLAVEAERPETLIGDVQASQITSLAATPDGRVFGGTANPGRLLEVLAAPARAGSFVSEVKDASLLADWGRISWGAEVPHGATLEMSVRSGNTPRPDDTWSAWSAPLRQPAGTPIDRPAARFLQYRAELRSGADGGPTLRSVEVFYLERNRPPEVASVELLPPGVVMLAQRGQQPPDQEAVARAEAEAAGSPQSARPSTRKTFQEGMRTVTWQASDPNGDALVFDVEVRAEAESDWRPLARGLQEEFLAFDSRQLADGRFRLRVVARDTPANPPDRELSGARVGEPLDVDNTPPQLRGLAVRGRGAARVAEFTATDGLGPIRMVRYSLDAADWVLALPEDGVPDGPREEFRIRLDGLQPGEHSLVVQARDAAGNLGADRIAFVVP